MPRWKLLKTWDRDLPGLSDEQLMARLSLAQEYEQSSTSKHGNPKARRDWRRRRESVEAEMQARGLPT